MTIINAATASSRLLLASIVLTACNAVFAQEQKPNIVVIWGDDIGMWNVGAYTHGMMGRTPNIDSLAKDGAIFTDHYGQPSCTAGRAAFITGQFLTAACLDRIRIDFV